MVQVTNRAASSVQTEVDRQQGEADNGAGVGESRKRTGARRVLRRGAAIAAFVVAWLLVYVGLVAWAGSLWVRHHFGLITVDQLVTNLPVGFLNGGAGAGTAGGGAAAADSGLFVSLVVWAFALPAVLVALFAWLIEKSRRSLQDAGVLGSTPRGDSRSSTTALWATRGFAATVAAVLAVAVAAAGIGQLSVTIGAPAYLQSITTSQDLGDYYVHPSPVARAAETTADPAAPGKPKNLVLIYLESIEDTFADDDTFELNMLEPLQESTAGWQAIPRFEQYPGGGWTMAGIVATQCGIPLRTARAASDKNTLNFNLEASSYLQGATCLGDVLQGEGYRNVFMGGADATFAAKETFLRGHGYDEVRDLREWRDAGETEVRSDWGLSDHRLMQLAKEEVSALHASGEPFNLSLLTLDTHESPYLHDSCDAEATGATDPMTSITRCSMAEVAGFVDYMRDEGMLDDTVVVVMGDHLKLEAEWASFWPELDGREGRTIFNRVWSPEPAEFAREGVDQLSMYPTILELSGLTLDGHRAGIGVSALAAASDVAPSSILDLTASDYDDLVRSRSAEFYRELWAAESTGV